jgi:phosphate:Na+ symporter
MTGSFDFWKLLAGLGIFLFGMFLLEDSVRTLSGRAFKHIIRLYTNGRLRSIASGILTTTILQSSSAVSLIVLAFVGAGVLSMENAIGVILGSNIGTTFTAWIVATLGFEIKIESFALPFIGIGGLGLILWEQDSRLYQICRLSIGFGFLFLGLDFMKGSVENFARDFDLSRLTHYGLWFYLLLGTVLTALMHSSAASIAIALTALHSGLITFYMGTAMVIGANVGTTITVLLGSLGGIPPKKRVAMSHLIFNVVTAAVAFAGLKHMVKIITFFFNIDTDSVLGLALFHSLFNSMGVILFFPFIRGLVRLLFRLFPDVKAILTVYINNTPTEVVEAAAAALKKEIQHLLHECQLYNLRLLKIDEKLVFDHELPFEKNAKKKFAPETLYEKIKLLHADIFAYYSRLQTRQMEESEGKELDRIIYASRNIMNSIKNFKGIRNDLDEFETSENTYLNTRYSLFRKRLVELYHDMNSTFLIENRQEQYRQLLKTIVHIEEDDKRFIRDTIKAVSEQKVHEIEISSLLLVNRLFTQACRLQIFTLKDLLLSPEQINDFDRAMDIKEMMEEETARSSTDADPHAADSEAPPDRAH